MGDISGRDPSSAAELEGWEMERGGEEKVELEDILNRLKEDGIDIKACSRTEHLCHLWGIYQRSEAMLQATKQDLDVFQKQQDAEMTEVDNYVEHIRNLSVEREAVTAEYEQENEILRAELRQLQLELETQVKEVEEMLDQEGLAEIAHSGPSEQVAYLLVERATLLEKLESAESKVENVAGNHQGMQVQIELGLMQQTMEEELKQQRESMQRTKETMAKTHEVDLQKEQKLRERAEQDVDEAAQRLQMAHEEIRRLTDELDMEKKVHGNSVPAAAGHKGRWPPLRSSQSSHGPLQLPGLFPTADLECAEDSRELNKAKEENIMLDQEILSLRSRVRSLDIERKSLLETVESLQSIQPSQIEQGSSLQNMEQVTPSFKSSDFNMNWDEAVQMDDQSEAPVPTVRKKKKSTVSAYSFTKDNQHAECEPESVLPELLYHDNQHPRTEELHKRCHNEISHLESKNHELQRKMQKLHQELEEVTLRNESLEAAMESFRHRPKDAPDCEKEVLRVKVGAMEADYAKLKRKYKELKAKGHDQDAQEFMQRSQEALENTQLRLEEEIKRRDYFESALAAIKDAKIREDEELEAFRTQVHHLNLELKDCRAAANQNQALNAVLDRIKNENCALEQKLNKVVEDYNNVCKCQNETSCNHHDVEEKYQCQITELKCTIQQLQEALNSHTMTGSSDQKVECLQQQLSVVLKENQQLNQEKLVLRQQFCTNQQGSQILNQEYSSLRQQLACYQQESKILTQDNCVVRQQLAGCQKENQRLTQEVCNIQTQLNDLLHSKEKVEDSINQVQLQALKMEMSHMQSSLEFEQKNACQQKQTLELQLDETCNRMKSQDALLAQHAEESRQLRQDLQRVHNLCSTAEKELKYKRDQLMEMQKQNCLLDQDNTRLNLDYKTMQCRLAEMDKHILILKSECEMKQQRLKELEIDSGKSFHLCNQLKCMQEELTTEKNRNLCAEKKAAELQQQINCIQHQLRLSEARSKERATLEAELKECREATAKLKNQLQEECIQRKLADQNTGELQQQLKSMQEKEGCLSRGKCDLQLQLQQQEARLQVLEEEKESMCTEGHCIQKSNKKLSDDLCARKQEIDKLKEEMQNILQQLDLQIRTYDEKQVRHKQKLRKAKEIFIREVMLRDGKIKHLETEVKLMKNLMDKEHAWNMKVTYENDLLLVEKRELLQQLNELDNSAQNNTSSTCNIKHRSSNSGSHTSSPTRNCDKSQKKSQKTASRINCSEENKQLQEETVKLSDRLDSLENTLRMNKTEPGKLQHHDSLSVSFAEDHCKFLFSDANATNGNFLSATRDTPSPGGSNNHGCLDIYRRNKALDYTDATKPTYTPSRMFQSDADYMNRSSCSRFRDQEESRFLGSDHV
ncbi:uncharacterized protein ccdc30 isoform X3 [Rhinoraja longicauda]